jgi:hypothetical protein
MRGIKGEFIRKWQHIPLASAKAAASLSPEKLALQEEIDPILLKEILRD